MDAKPLVAKENDRLELQPVLGHYSSTNIENKDSISGDKDNDPLQPTRESTSTSNSPASDDERLLEEEQDERLWIKLFPWLLKWSWFRNRRYKNPNGNSKFIAMCIALSIICNV